MWNCSNSNILFCSLTHSHTYSHTVTVTHTHTHTHSHLRKLRLMQLLCVCQHSTDMKCWIRLLRYRGNERQMESRETWSFSLNRTIISSPFAFLSEEIQFRFKDKRSGKQDWGPQRPGEMELRMRGLQFRLHTAVFTPPLPSTFFIHTHTHTQTPANRYSLWNLY